MIAKAMICLKNNGKKLGLKNRANVHQFIAGPMGSAVPAQNKTKMRKLFIAKKESFEKNKSKMYTFLIFGFLSKSNIYC